jgi:hypothetical protein
MIKQIVAMLQLDDFYGESELIDIAKGKYQYNTSMKKMWKQAKRNKLYNVRNKEN